MLPLRSILNQWIIPNKTSPPKSTSLDKEQESDCFDYPASRYISHSPIHKWELTESVHFENITVPAGFQGDKTSTPRILWAIFPPFGIYEIAAWIHDYLYELQPQGISRKEADDYFYRALHNYACPRIHPSIIFLFYLVVRLFGSKAWDRYKKNLQNTTPKGLAHPKNVL